jgi:hypothetical protein
MIAVMSGPSSRVDGQRDQVGDEDVGAELPELHDRLERGHHADEERDHDDDRHAVGTGALHDARHGRPS